MQTDDPQTLSDVLDDDVECAVRLMPLWAQAKLQSDYPAATEHVANLFRGCGFDCSLELLENWCRSGMVPNAKIRAGQFVWFPKNIVTAWIQLESWRRWLPLSALHLHKMTAVELLEGEARLAGTTAFEDLAMFDANAFVRILADCDNRDLRQTFAVALQTKLRNLGVLDQ